MPRAKKVPNHAVPYPGVGADGKPTAVGSTDSVSPVSDVQKSAARLEAASQALRELLSRDDGWLRIVPQDHGKQVFYKWKFSRGDWRGYYIGYMDKDFDWVKSIIALEAKVNDIDVGVRRPALDTPYGD